MNLNQLLTLDFWRRLLTSRLFITGLICLLGALLAYWRYPNYLLLPNFYSEDGTIFAQNILDKGFLGALFTPFNGYLVWGLYLLEGVGFALNALLGGNILTLPTAFAGVSYLFWGAVCSLPMLLFWREVKSKKLLALICVALALLPLPSFNYAILGAIGNYKFAFLFIAFLLLLKRHWLPKTSKLFWVIDAALIVCAFTNVTVVLLLPFAALRYLPGIRGFGRTFFAALRRDKSFWSLCLVASIVLIEVIAALSLGGLSNIKGYMSEPFEFAKTIEIFVYRTFLFPVAFPIAKHLNDLAALLLFAISIGCLYKIALPKDRFVLWFGLYAAFIGTLVFVTQRTGVSIFFVNYTTSATDQFFYAQNWIMLFTALFILARAVGYKSRKWAGLISLAVLILLPIGLLAVNNVSLNNSLQRERRAGAFKQNALYQCQQTRDAHIKAQIYPVEAKAFMTLNRQEVCAVK